MIGYQEVKISFTEKTGDKSEVSVPSMPGISHANIFLAIVY